MDLPTLEVRPGWAGRGSVRLTRFLVELGVAIIVSLIVSPVGLAIAGMDHSWIIDIPLVSAVGIAGAAFLLYLKNARVGIVDGELYRVSAFGQRHNWPIAKFYEVVRVQITVGLGWSSDWPFISPGVIDADLLVGARGLVVTSFTGMWPRHGLSRLWGAMGLRVRQPWHGTVSVKELRRRYAGAVPILPSSW
jgi:hypothetical protein